MKKLTTLLVAVALTTSFVQAAQPANNKRAKQLRAQQQLNINNNNHVDVDSDNEGENNQAPTAPTAPVVPVDQPGFFSRQVTNVKGIPAKVASMPGAYVNKNVAFAQYVGDKLSLEIAKRPVAVTAFGPANEKGDAVVTNEVSAIEAHPYRATAVVTSALAGTVYGIYKLGQYVGVNAKIAKAFDALCSKLGFVSEEEQIKAAIVNCKNVLVQKGLPADAIADAKAQLAKLEAALKNAELRAEALANVVME